MTRTLTALYQTRQDAEAARDRLKSAGINSEVDIHDETTSDSSGAHGTGGFMEKLKTMFGGHEDTHVYDEGVRRGHFLLTVGVPEAEAERAALLLDATDAVDLDHSQESWRSEGWTPPSEATPSGATGRATRADEEEVIPIAEERLRVSKREVERGGVRVRAYVVETPVHEQIGLRDEHVSVERRPVDRPATGAEAAFQERNLEFTETAEEAVVAKDAVIREELVVRKKVGERTEEVNETVRRTEVDVDDTRGRGTPPVR